MNENKEWVEWEECFRSEQKGVGPDERIYDSLPPLRILPYQSIGKGVDQSFDAASSSVSHWFWVNEQAIAWLLKHPDNLRDYRVKGFVGTLDSEQVAALQHASATWPGAEDISFKPESGYEFINLATEEALPDARKVLINLVEHPGSQVAFLPGDDFIRNVAVIRGVFKSAHRKGVLGSTARSFFGMIDPGIFPVPVDERMLIPLTNRILAMMVCGIGDIIWDLRFVDSWPVSHLHYLLNIPEILHREGQVLREEDPLKGSSFFETFSDHVARYLEE